MSEVLSNPIASQFEQVDGFLNNTRLKTGKQKKIDIGAVFLTFFCKNCNANITFLSGEELHCIGINDHLVSIDCVVSCSRCGQTVPIWFLVESRNEIYSRVPEVRILKRTEKLSDKVLLGTERYGEYSTWLEKADRAYVMTKLLSVFAVRKGASLTLLGSLFSCLTSCKRARTEAFYARTRFYLNFGAVRIASGRYGSECPQPLAASGFPAFDEAARNDLLQPRICQ